MGTWDIYFHFIFGLQFINELSKDRMIIQMPILFSTFRFINIFIKRIIRDFKKFSDIDKNIRHPKNYYKPLYQKLLESRIK